jgi:hypothetical protein
VVEAPATQRSRRATGKPPADWAHQFLIVLAKTDPPVWRRIQVPERDSFWDLHVAIQDAMGWSDCHLHAFRVVIDAKVGRVERFGIPFDDLPAEPPVRPDWTVRVSEIVGKGDLPMLYVYDFGDDRHHVVIYEGAVQLDRDAPHPRCVSGARRCPPEDCGGPHGYADLLDAVRDPTHARHTELLEWVGGHFDPDAFDAAGVRFDDPKKRWNTAFAKSPE